jgi:branched-chain amino acid transport system permease protein
MSLTTAQSIPVSATPRSTTATVFTDPLLEKPAIWVAPVRAVWPLVLSLAICSAMFIFILPKIGAYQQDRLANCGIAIILAVSLTVVNGFTGQFSIGHSGFMAVGGYAAASLMYYGTAQWFGDPTDPTTHGFFGGLLSWTGARADFTGHLLARGDLLFLASLIFGAVVAAAIGWVVGLPSLRLRGDYLAIVTLGFCEIVRVIIQSSPDQLIPKPTDPDDVGLGAPSQYLGDRSLPYELHHLGGALGFSGAPTYASVFWIALAALGTVALTIRLKYSGYGRAMLSIREDDIASQSVGVNITRLKVRAFMYSAFFAGLGGGLFALHNGNINAGEMGFQRSFDFIIMVVVGGLGSISGAAIAAVLITLLPEWLRSPADLTPWHWCHTYTQFALLIVVVIIAWSSPKYGRKPLITCLFACAIWEVVRREAVYYQVDLSMYRMVIFSILLIVTMILRPQGLFGVREIWDYLPEKWHWWNRSAQGAEA